MLSLRDEDGKQTKSVQRVSSELRVFLGRVELNAHTFISLKAILEAMVDTVELEIPDRGWLIYDLNEQLQMYVGEYNLRLGRLKEGPKSWSD